MRAISTWKSNTVSKEERVVIEADNQVLVEREGCYKVLSYTKIGQVTIKTYRGLDRLENEPIAIAEAVREGL